MTPLETTFELLGNTLRVRGELRHDEEKPFEEALRKLMDTDHAPLVIDLSAVSSMSGSYVRDIALALAWAKQKRRAIRVRASRQVFHVLKLARVKEPGRIELANERTGPPAWVGRRAKCGTKVQGMREGRLMGSAKRKDSPGADSAKAEARARRERRLKAKRKKKRARRRMDE